MKYDIKKMEEVVYDISLRGLVKSPAGQKSQSNEVAAASTGDAAMSVQDADMPSAKRVRDPPQS